MLIPVGEEVVILDSGITGIVQYYDGSTAFILADGELYQAHKNDIAATKEFGQKAKTQVSESGDNPALPATQGVYIIWKAQHNLSGQLQHFDIIVQNFSEVELQCQYIWFLNDEVHTTIRKPLARGGEIFLHTCKPDQINDRPAWHMQCWKKDPAGVTIQVADHQNKFRAKQYIAKLQSAAYLESQQFVFEVPITDASIIRKPEAEKKAKPDFDFAQKKKVEAHHEVLQKAHMPDHIDLHIEKLVPDHRHMNNTEILTTQMHAFRNFLEKAIRLRMHKIYVVHGLGKGILKQEIEKALKKYPEVSSHNNNYSPRFGFGATEIHLED